MVAVSDPEHSQALDAAARLWGRTYTDEELANQADLYGAFQAMSESRMWFFNVRHGTDDRVYYQSWAGVSAIGPSSHYTLERDREACEDKLDTYWNRRDRIDPTLAVSALLVQRGTERLTNDGMVTVESAKWGSFRGCIPADHLDQVGGSSTALASRLHTGFDHERFLRNVAFELASLGY